MKMAIRLILIIDVIILIVMAGVAIGGETRYGTLLIWSGVVIAVVGAMAPVGAESVQGEYNLKFDQIIPQLNYHRTDEKLKEIEKSYDFSTMMTIAGAVLVVLGLGINKIFTGGI